jgi:hypothetical protein
MDDWNLLWEYISSVTKCVRTQRCPYAQVVYHSMYHEPVRNVELLAWIQQGEEFPCGVVFGERPCLVRSDSDADILPEGKDNQPNVGGHWTYNLGDHIDAPWLDADALERVRRMLHEWNAPEGIFIRPEEEVL